MRTLVTIQSDVEIDCSLDEYPDRLAAIIRAFEELGYPVEVIRENAIGTDEEETE